jgi:CubicO group peptidase (beta-lactamase class C family)
VPLLDQACALVLTRLADRRYAHTTHFSVHVDGRPVVDEHLHGPVRGDVFSVTKTVLATALAAMAADGLLPDLGDELRHALPDVAGTPAAALTWRHLLTMTRGAVTDGAWDVDAVTARPGGQVRHIACAPQRHPPGDRFAYDNGAAHLLSAAASQVLGESVSDYARRRVFAPLGISGEEWLTDPDGVPFGYAHLRLTGPDLARLGHAWLRAAAGADDLLDPAFVAAMTTAHSPGGPPEQLGYGYLTWVGDGFFAAAGWAGHLVLVAPASRAVVVTTGDPGFTFGPPPRDELPADWAPAFELVKRHLLPVVAGQPAR